MVKTHNSEQTCVRNKPSFKNKPLSKNWLNLKTDNCLGIVKAEIEAL